MKKKERPFSEDMEKLIELFKQLKNRADSGVFQEMNPVFYRNLDMLINNYEMIKRDFSPEMLDKMGGTFHAMVKDLLAKLREQMGNEFVDDLLTGDSLEEEVKRENKVITPSHIEIALESEDDDEENLIVELQKIEKKLKRPVLNNKEIDDLLDRRTEILQLLKTENQ